MNHLLEHIAQLKSNLTDFIQEAEPYLDKKTCEEKNAQLQSIDKSIKLMQKSDTAIPAELRNLKIRLISELATINDLQMELADLQLIISSLNKRKPKATKSGQKLQPKTLKNKIKEQSLITLTDLIKEDILRAPFVLVKVYKGQTYKAKVTEKGVIELELKGQKHFFNSPSAAAVAATRKAQNGWTWWSVENNPQNISLDTYRKKLIQQ